MFGFLKRRRLAQEAAAEAERQRLRALADRQSRMVQRETFQGGKSSLSSSAPQYASRGDDSLSVLSPLHPLSPFGVASQVAAFSSVSDPEPVRSGSHSHCVTAASDDSWSRSSSSDSCGSSSWGGSDSSSSSSYDSGSSSSYDSSSSY